MSLHPSTRARRKTVLSALLLVCLLGGCAKAVAPTTAQGRPTLPANTVQFSTFMMDLSGQPGFLDEVTSLFGKRSQTGAAVFSPKLVQYMRKMIREGSFDDLDTFPGWPMGDINPVVDLSGDVDKSLARPKPEPLTAYLDLGEYDLARTQPADLDHPSTLPDLVTDGLMVPVFDGVLYGDGPNAKIAPMHSESVRLAEVLNRLSINPMDGVAPMAATFGGRTVSTPEDLIRALAASGHTVTVADARYFANFGHLHYEGMDVMMPFWVSAGVRVPGTHDPLIVPVSHAEYEWFVRGPKINADISFYFGIDGKAEFRTMDTLDQIWVMGRHAHEYTGADAIEVTRLTGLLALAYAHAHQANPLLPFGGYYTLGVCQDGVSAIERKMTGKVTLFPNTVDAALFKDPRDGEINALLAAIPNDRKGRPQMERVFGSLPTTDLASITVPGLGATLEKVQDAWHDGTLERTLPPVWVLLLVACAMALPLIWLFRTWRRED